MVWAACAENMGHTAGGGSSCSIRSRLSMLATYALVAVAGARGVRAGAGPVAVAVAVAVVAVGLISLSGASPRILIC